MFSLGHFAILICSNKYIIINILNFFSFFVFLIEPKIRMSHFEARLLRICDLAAMFENIMKIKKKAYKKIKKVSKMTNNFDLLKVSMQTIIKKFFIQAGYKNDKFIIK